jgi:hypothetical protein
MAVPPSLVGAVKLTVAVFAPVEVALPIVGAPGVAIGTAGNIALTIDPLALFEEIAPITVKKSAEIPVTV